MSRSVTGINIPGTAGASRNRDRGDGQDFEWPPPEYSDNPSLHSATEPDPGPGQPSEPPAHDPARRLAFPVPEDEGAHAREPYLVLRQVIQERSAAAAGKPDVPADPPPASGAPARAGFWPRISLLVLLAVTAVAGLEGVYIFRGTLDPRMRTGASPRSGQVEPSAPSNSPEPAATTGSTPRVADPSPAPTPPGPPPAEGSLTIRSDPSGARVEIDGRTYGITPLKLASVTAGERRIVLRLDGKEVRQTIRIEPGSAASLVVPMPPADAAGVASGWLAISSPAPLDILEDGVVIGTTRSPQVLLPAGSHALHLVNEALGFDQPQQVQVEVGKVARISLELPQSLVHVNALPWAQVFIDGKAVGETPIGNLPVTIGTHEVLFRHPDLGEKRLTTVVKAGEAARLSVDMRK